MKYLENNTKLNQNGFSILDNFYTDSELGSILKCIEKIEKKGNSFLKTKDLFAIRQLIKNAPELEHLLFNQNLFELVSDYYKNKNYFLTKAIYFDKPSESNWFVGYHQDLSISVDRKIDLPNYMNWTFKKGQYGVQPPIRILEDTMTVRIHLDNTNKENGALKVIPKSHVNGIIRAESKSWDASKELICNVKKGGVMLMKPLTLHSSSRTTNGKQRRVIHLEFNTQKLEEPLQWLEYLKI